MFVQYFPDICPIFAQYLPNISTIYARYLPNILPIFAKYLHNINQNFIIPYQKSQISKKNPKNLKKNLQIQKISKIQKNLKNPICSILFKSIADMHKFCACCQSIYIKHYSVMCQWVWCPLLWRHTDTFLLVFCLCVVTLC